MLAATRELFSGIESHHNGLASILLPGPIGLVLTATPKFKAVRSRDRREFFSPDRSRLQ